MLHQDTSESGNFTRRWVWIRNYYSHDQLAYGFIICDRQDFARESDVDSQLCVYVKGERVVDLWGSHGTNRDENYGPDSLQNIFSSGKSVASICMACLVDRGLLDYNATVLKYWPGIESLLRIMKTTLFHIYQITPRFCQLAENIRSKCIHGHISSQSFLIMGRRSWRYAIFSGCVSSYMKVLNGLQVKMELIFSDMREGCRGSTKRFKGQTSSQRGWGKITLGKS